MPDGLKFKATGCLVVKHSGIVVGMRRTALPAILGLRRCCYKAGCQRLRCCSNVEGVRRQGGFDRVEMKYALVLLEFDG